MKPIFFRSQAYTQKGYRIVPKTTPRYMKFSQIKIRAVHEVVLFQGSCYITFLKIVQPMTILNSYASRPIKLLIYLSHTLAILNPTSHCSRMHVQNTCTCIFSIFRNLSCSKMGRVIFEVALYENSMKKFSHYIRGRVVIEVVLFWGLYGIFWISCPCFF